ncbi:MAG: cupin domain-containing protein [Chloroflexota bacterium]
MDYIRPVDFAAFPADEFNSQPLADRSTGLDSCVCLCTRVPPGKRTSIGLHVHEVDQVYFILRGHMRVEIAGKEYDAGPRTLVHLPAGVPHFNWNPGTEEELHFELLVPSPPRGTPLWHPPVEASPLAAPSSGTLIRHVRDEEFSAEHFAWVTLKDRASGLGSASLGLFRVLPGGQSPALHAHKFDQIYYVVSGQMQLRIGFERLSAAANSVVVLPAGMPHANWNEGPETVTFVNVRVPQPLRSEAEEPWDIPVGYGAAAPEAS